MKLTWYGHSAFRIEAGAIRLRNMGPRLGGPAFLAAHPKLSIDLVLNDRTVDLIEEGVDIGLRWRRALSSLALAGL